MDVKYRLGWENTGWLATLATDDEIVLLKSIDDPNSPAQSRLSIPVYSCKFIRIC